MDLLYLKEDKDVQEYLKNMLTEYSFSCYKEKNAEVCHLLGDYYEAISRDFKKAAEVYKNNCDNLDYGRSCAKIGGWFLVGKGCDKNVLTAFEYMKKGCELNDVAGCTNTGIVSIMSSEVQGDNKVSVIENGIKFLRKACFDMKNERACFFLSSVYMRGIEGVVEKTPTEAYRVSLRACELGNPYACSNVAYMHNRGEGAQKNLKLAETFKKRAIELEEALKGKTAPIKFGQGIKT